MPFTPRLFTDQGFVTTVLFSATTLDIAYSKEDKNFAFTPYLQGNALIKVKEIGIAQFLYQENSLEYEVNRDRAFVAVPSLQNLLTAGSSVSQELASSIALFSIEQSDKVRRGERADITFSLIAAIFDWLRISEGEKIVLTSLLSSYRLTHEKGNKKFRDPTFISSVVVPAVIKAYLKLKG